MDKKQDKLDVKKISEIIKKDYEANHLKLEICRPNKKPLKKKVSIDY